MSCPKNAKKTKQKKEISSCSSSSCSSSSSSSCASSYFSTTNEKRSCSSRSHSILSIEKTAAQNPKSRASENPKSGALQNPKSGASQKGVELPIIDVAPQASTTKTERKPPKKMQDVIESAPRLKLNLGGRGMRKYDVSVLDPPMAKKLTTLILCDNKLVEIDSALFTKVPTLTVLDLARNQLKKLPSKLGQLKQLRSINLSSNNFTAFPMSLCLITTLEILDVSHNFLPLIPPEIGKLKKLRSLNLTENFLSHIPIELGLLEKCKLECDFSIVLGNAEPITFLKAELQSKKNLGLTYPISRTFLYPQDELSLHLLHMLQDQGQEKERFRKFLSNERCVENLEFWETVNGFRALTHAPNSKALVKVANQISLDFLGTKSKSEINLLPQIAFDISRKIKSNRVSHSLFDEAQKYVFELMRDDVFARFRVLSIRLENDTTTNSSEE